MKVTIDGKEYECKKVVMDNDNVEIVLEESNKKKTGYERVNIGDIYYSASMHAEIRTESTELSDKFSNGDYDDANYYSSDEIAQNNARADRLMRRLRRFSVENRKLKPDWTNEIDYKYCIAYDHSESIIKVGYAFVSESFGVIYFDSKELAEQAIKEFKDELIWYFTEYKDSL